MQVKLDDEKADRIAKFVKDGRFDSIDSFVDRALELLLYAEDNRDRFQKFIK